MWNCLSGTCVHDVNPCVATQRVERVESQRSQVRPVLCVVDGRHRCTNCVSVDGMRIFPENRASASSSWRFCRSAPLAKGVVQYCNMLTTFFSALLCIVWRSLGAGSNTGCCRLTVFSKREGRGWARKINKEIEVREGRSI